MQDHFDWIGYTPNTKLKGVYPTHTFFTVSGAHYYYQFIYLSSYKEKKGSMRRKVNIENNVLALELSGETGLLSGISVKGLKQDFSVQSSVSFF